MGHPRPLDKLVWVEHESGKQKVVPRSELPSLTEKWHRILDPTKKAAAPAEPADDAPAPKKRTRPAKPDSEKE